MFVRDNPIELPDGQLVCGAHGWVVCGICPVDYSFLDETLGFDENGLEQIDDEFAYESSDNEAAEPKIYVGTGEVLPEKFDPSESPSCTEEPLDLFSCQQLGPSSSPNPPILRYINRTNPEEMLIYTDGACLYNGQQGPSGGWGFVYSESDSQAGPLANIGPMGEKHEQTSNRAELTAVIEALRFRWWPALTFTSVVIATDSQYVVDGITSHVRGWLQNGWKTSAGEDVKNKDLWQVLLGESERYDRFRFKIKYWRIPRESNTEADRLAKQAASASIMATGI